MVINCLREKCPKPLDNSGGVIQLQNMDERNIVVDMRLQEHLIDEIASARNNVEIEW